MSIARTHKMLAGLLWNIIWNVLVVHLQHVEAQVKNGKKAAQTLAELLAAGMLHGIWVPHKYIRDLRILTSQRRKMGRLGAIAKNRDVENSFHELLRTQLPSPPSEKAWRYPGKFYSCKRIANCITGKV